MIPDGVVTWAEIDLDAIAQNVQAIKAFVGSQTEIIASVKANAYGHGMEEAARALRGRRRGRRQRGEGGGEHLRGQRGLEHRQHAHRWVGLRGRVELQVMMRIVPDESYDRSSQSLLERARTTLADHQSCV